MTWLREHWFEMVGAAIVLFYVFFAFPALFAWDEQATVDRGVLQGFEGRR